MVTNVSIAVVVPGQQSFVPGAFGGASQVVLNTTSFDDILAQIHNVGQSLAAQRNGSSDPAPITLVSTGCYLNASAELAAGDGAAGVRASDGFYRDCATACASPEIMFNSSYTFWNCMTLGATTQYIERQGLAVDGDDLDAVGSRMGFERLSQFNSTQIFSDALSCIKGSCQDYSLGSCTSDVATMDISGVTNQAEALFNGLQGYCTGMDDVVDSDIAGPGVVLSYILQAAIAIATYVLINFFTSWLQPILSFLYTVQETLSGPPTGRASDTAVGLQPRKTPWQRAGEHQRALAHSRAAAALTSGLIEFQEAQGFFVLSIQLATLFIFASSDHSAMLSSTNSFAEAVVNVEAVQMLSINGLLPVMFTQLGLMRLGIRWWYLNIVLLSVFTLTVMISQKGLMPQYEVLWEYFKAQSPIGMCGGNPSPMTYCLSSLNGINGALQRMNSGLYVGIGAMPAYLTDQLWHFLNRHGKLDKALDDWELTSPRLLFFRRRVWPPFIKTWWGMVEFTLMVFTGMYLKSVVDILQFVGTAASNWTFGQLIAIMIWAPVIGKYVYYNVFGISEGVGRRLTDRYKVVEVSSDDDDDLDGAGGSRVKMSSKEEDEGIEMDFSRKDMIRAFSREDTLVATMTPDTPSLSFDGSPYHKAFGGGSNNPFDRRHERKLDDF